MTSCARYFSASKAKKSRIGDLLKWIDDNADAMLDDPQNGLEAIGVGKKNTGTVSESGDHWCITGFVRHKVTKKALKSAQFNDFAQIARTMPSKASKLEKPETDVVEVGDSFSAQSSAVPPAAFRGIGGAAPLIDLQQKFSVLRAGLGITNPVGVYPDFSAAGTFGFAVKDSSGKQYLVSNNHVIARNNAARKGNAIVQPGTLDLTQTEIQLMNTLAKLRSRLTIAKLSAWVDIDFDNKQNDVDVAIAELTDDRDLSELGRIGLGSKARGIAKKFTVDANGMLIGDTRVYKAGRTTGWTEGAVTAIGLSVDVGYPVGTARFKNQIAVIPTIDNGGPFSDRGDSGSGVWNSNNELVGLLFAGGPNRTLINPIDVVLKQITAELNRGPLSLIT